MGLAKQHLADIEARGYGDTDKKVCADCIGDIYISDKIRYSHNPGRCSFCGSYRNVLPLTGVLSIIVPVIRQEYEPAINAVPYDSDIKDYAEPVLDPYDFVHDELNEYLEISNDNLLQELVDVLTFEDRVSTYRYSLRPHEEDLQAWDEYCKLVKSTPLSAEQIVSLDREKNLPDEIEAIHGTLAMVYDHCKKLHMVKILYGLSSQYKAHNIYRCVNYLPSKAPYNGLGFIPASFVGTSPAKNVSDNRMSEKGDMMFYGAEEKETAMIEVGRHKNEPNNPATIATFHPNKQFKVLDLTGVYSWMLPSIFDTEHSEERRYWFFLQEFTKRISERKHSSGDKDFYKPTQVLTKYIQRKTGLQGIMYNSSVTPDTDKICYVLFVTNRNCLDKDDMRDSSRNQLVMEKVEQVDFSSVGL